MQPDSTISVSRPSAETHLQWAVTYNGITGYTSASGHRCIDDCDTVIYHSPVEHWRGVRLTVSNGLLTEIVGSGNYELCFMFLAKRQPSTFSKRHGEAFHVLYASG